MIIHFGKNPVSGGRPPRDSNISEIIVSIAGVLFHRSEIELMVIELFSISAMNIGAAIIFRICVWLSPPHAPMKIEVIASIKMIVELSSG
ncbi:hypothetical protein PBNK65E_000502400 [Plasmodium berghei]|uniref:Uncharacterized protein n=1 Tax=Plasmodium berghei TaxID=5821 RepID=A0A1D3JNY2_PLABE|nr:hypothetical protein PBNK65E_000502400 [Plasmodium berghei]